MRELTAETNGLSRLRAYATSAAQADIQSRHRSYVNAVRTYTRLTDDLEAVFQASTARVPQNVRAWAPLLSAIFDVEHVRRKFLSALAKARAAASPDSSDDFDYHREHWLFQGGAFIDRVRNVVKKAVRLLGPHSVFERQSMERDLVDRINRDIGAAWKSVRDPLAHELGGGVDALTPYWLPLLAMDSDKVDIERVTREIARSANEAKATRPFTELADAMMRTTVAVIERCEGVIVDLVDRLERGND